MTYHKGGPNALSDAGSEQLDWYVRLAEFLLGRIGVPDLDQKELLAPSAALHAALTTPGQRRSSDLQKGLGQGARRVHDAVKQAYMAVGLELRWRIRVPDETERDVARVIGKAFGVSETKVIGWRDTAKHRNPKYPLLRDKFWEALQLLEQSFPDRPQEQYETWRRCAAGEWLAKI